MTRHRTLHISKEKIVLITILILSLIPRLAGLGSFSLNGDEPYTAWEASKPIPEMMDSLKSDPHPPLHYLFLNIWYNISSSEFGLRLTSAIFGIATVFAVYLLGKRAYGSRPALIAAFLTAIAQIHIKYSQNLRSYEMFVFLGAIATYYFLNILQKGEPKWKVYALYILFSLLALYTHYFTAFILAGHAIYFIIKYRGQRKIMKKYALALKFIFILFIPGLLLFMQQHQLKTEFDAEIWDNSMNAEWLSFRPDTSNVMLRNAMMIFHLTAGMLPASTNMVFMIILGITLIAIAISAYYVYNHLLLHTSQNKSSRMSNKKKKKNKQDKGQQSRESTWLFLLIILSTLIGLSAIWYFKIILPLTYARYLLFLTPFYYLLIAKGVSKAPRGLGIVVLGFLLIGNSVSMHNYYKTDYEREDWRQATEMIGHVETEDTAILLYPDRYVINLIYYYDGNSDMYGASNLMPLKRGMIDQAAIFKTIDARFELESTCPVYDVMPEHEKLILITSIADSPGTAIEECLKQKYKVSGYYENRYQDIWGEMHNDIKIWIFEPNV